VGWPLSVGQGSYRRSRSIEGDGVAGPRVSPRIPEAAEAGVAVIDVNDGHIVGRLPGTDLEQCPITARQARGRRLSDRTRCWAINECYNRAKTA
jgi:hypothetical protein